MNIVTLTLNPAIDVHCVSRDFKPYHESYAEITSRDAGGKGVNISRALAAFGVDSLAVLIAGDENGKDFCNILQKEGINVTPVFTKGRIRENITIHEDGKAETRISFSGFRCSGTELSLIAQRIGEVDGDTVVTFTGSIPDGIAKDDVLALLGAFKEKGAKIVIDSRSVSPEDIKEFKPWLIKPNREEAEKYFGVRINSAEDAATLAAELYNAGVENAMISLGGEGLILANREGVFKAISPKIEVLSTIGAGDSAIAGFIDAVSKGAKAEEAVRRAAAFGSAACMREGTDAPLMGDVERLEREITVTKF